MGFESPAGRVGNVATRLAEPNGLQHAHHPEVWMGQCASHLLHTTPPHIRRCGWDSVPVICFAHNPPLPYTLRHYRMWPPSRPYCTIASVLPELQPSRQAPCTCTNACPTQVRHARVTDTFLYELV
eukprot:354619-Chlamydomonas_euryale.AAC.6